MPIQRSSFPAQRYVRLLLVVIAIAGCLLAIRQALAYGASRVLTTFAYMSGNLAAANKAIQLTPKDAEAHFAGAALLTAAGNAEQSLAEVDQAVALRPADYRLWSQLGLLRDQTGDSAGALLAFDEAIKRAPYYSQPRWDRGNVLLRNRQYEAGFKDLNEAAQSNQELIPGLIDLAWGLSRGDVKLTEDLAQVTTERKRIAFAKLLARNGKAQESIGQFGSVNNIPETLKRELTDQLISREAFKEASEVWNSIAGHSAVNAATAVSIYDGGFEGTLAFGESGFAWRVPQAMEATSVAQDASQPDSGTKSLRIDFSGNATGSISQLIALEPSRHYRINFAAKSQDLVTGGLPYVLVSAPSRDFRPLGRSDPLAKGTSGWQHYSFEFTTPPGISGVLLSLPRETCTSTPCPIFGSVLIDSFSIEELKVISPNRN